MTLQLAARSRPDGRPRTTPGLALQPWRQTWQVCFLPCWQHWTMRPFRLKPPFQHVFLLRPYESVSIGASRWLYVEWSFMGAVTVLLDEIAVQPIHRRVSEEGAMLHYRGTVRMPPPRMGNGLWPLTCVTYARQVLGLPFRYSVWTPIALWNELLETGARIVIENAPRSDVR